MFADDKKRKLNALRVKFIQKCISSNEIYLNIHRYTSNTLEKNARPTKQKQNH